MDLDELAEKMRGVTLTMSDKAIANMYQGLADEAVTLAQSLRTERDTLRRDVERLTKERDEALRRALGHAYAAQMAEGGETIERQELARERREHAETRAEMRRLTAQVERLRGAARPFADDARWYCHYDGDAVMRNCWPEARDALKAALADAAGEDT